jgi:hypothetical protein
MKSRVPSMGSTIQTRIAWRREPSSGTSSDRTASPGKAARSRSTIRTLAAMSASVTGSPSCLWSTRMPGVR